MRRYSKKAGFGSAARLVALVALAGFQLAYAGHESQHAAGDLAETCAACAHLDQNTPAAPDAVSPLAAAAAGETGRAAASAALSRRERGCYAIRAPPSL